MSSFWLEQPDPDLPPKVVVSSGGTPIYCDHCPCCSTPIREATRGIGTVSISVNIVNRYDTTDPAADPDGGYTTTFSGTKTLSRVAWSPNATLTNTFVALEYDCCQCRIDIGQTTGSSMSDGTSGFLVTFAGTTVYDDPAIGDSSETYQQGFSVTTVAGGAKGPCNSYSTTASLQPYISIRLDSFGAFTDISGSWSTNISAGSFSHGIPGGDPLTGNFPTNSCVGQSLDISASFVEETYNLQATVSISIA